MLWECGRASHVPGYEKVKAIDVELAPSDTGLAIVRCVIHHLHLG